MTRIYRIAVAPKFPKEKVKGVYTIYNLEMETEEAQKMEQISRVLLNPEIQKIVEKLPDGDFHEVMYKNVIVDPQAKTIGDAGLKKVGVNIEALKVGMRYYGDAFNGVYVNPSVEICFTEEPQLETLKPQGSRPPMDTFNLIPMSDEELLKVSRENNLSLPLKRMRKIQKDQATLGLPYTTDLELDVYAIWWCDHCKHTSWQEWGQLLQKLRKTTGEINNPNVISAFLDNAGVWEFYDDHVLVFGGETHNSPSKKWAFGGQITKTLGHDRDILMTGRGAKPIMHLEMTTVGEFDRKVYPVLERFVSPEAELARETIAAVSKAGNTMGIPMGLARMYSHPAFGVKPFAFGGTVGMTIREAALKVVPEIGDLAVLAGGYTGNDGYHGGTVASDELTKILNAAGHVQIGDPFTQQKFMRAIVEFLRAKCTAGGNDFGAGGFISAFGEPGAPQKLLWGGYIGGLLLNLAMPFLKCAALPHKIVAIGESQERFAFRVKPEMLLAFSEICKRLEIDWVVVGVFNGSERLQVMYDENVREFTKDTPLSGEILFDRTYEMLEECPIDLIELIEPPTQDISVEFPEITLNEVEAMAERVVGHFDNCNQARAKRQYDSTVQGICVQGPLYGVNYNVGSHLAVEKPVYGKPYCVTVSKSFNPWLLEVDPIMGAYCSYIDAYLTQVAAGVELLDVGFVDNFYTPNLNPYAPWYVSKQVEILCEISRCTRAPFINGKDSNYGSGEYEGQIINIPPSVNIMAVGKMRHVNQLILHQWKRPGNLLYSLGKRSVSLAGSTLASTLEIKGGRVDSIPMHEVVSHTQRIKYSLEDERIISATPINRGGLIMRLFEGVEASGFGVETDLCAELFPESFGNLLVEVSPRKRSLIESTYCSDALLVGEITPHKGITVRGKQLNWDKLFTVWNTKFEKEVYGNDK